MSQMRLVRPHKLLLALGGEVKTKKGHHVIQRREGPMGSHN